MTRAAARPRMPLPALLVLLLCSGILVPLLLMSGAEDEKLSETATGRLLPGGETVKVGGRGSSQPMCRNSPVEFMVGDRTYTGSTPVRGIECPSSGSVEIEVRYDPDDPTQFSNNERQPLVYVAAGLSALGFLLALLVLVRRVVARLVRKRG